ncbi:MAG: hypothetical protein LBQ88_15795 [Treponema sp.]|jgi:hypothetical protein|nr:hypothetical protein [Treponema sp.]
MLVSYSPLDGGNMERKGDISFVFNKPLDIISFNENFSLSPYSSTAVLFSPDKKSVTITAPDGWPVNQIYTWSVSPKVLSDDGYGMLYTKSGSFATDYYTELPDVQEVCPAADADGMYIYQEGVSIEGSLMEYTPIGIIFSKPMEKFSVQQAFTLEPSLSGELRQDAENKARYVFIPAEPYAINERYKMSISRSAQDTEGLSIYDTFTIFFNSINEYLTISSIQLDSSTTAADFSNNDIIHDHTFTLTNPVNARNWVMICIKFSSNIEAALWQKTVESIQITPVFPSTAASPYLISAAWNIDGSECISTWENFTRSSGGVSNYYMIKIAGGKNGVQNGRGEYIENDIWLIIKAL